MHLDLATIVMVVMKNMKLLLDSSEVILYDNINTIFIRRPSFSRRSFTRTALKTSNLTIFCSVNVIKKYLMTIGISHFHYVNYENMFRHGENERSSGFSKHYLYTPIKESY